MEVKVPPPLERVITVAMRETEAKELVRAIRWMNTTLGAYRGTDAITIPYGNPKWHADLGALRELHDRLSSL